MREAFDAPLRTPYAQKVPRHYTYLRTTPEAVFPAPLFGRFMSFLRQWCMENLGVTPGIPNLHLMVNGCKLELHSDFHNGAWGYVYSLTRWEQRKFSGGETALLHDGIPSYKKHHAHGDALYAAALGKISPGLLGKLRPGGSRDCARNLARVAGAGTEVEGHLR